MIINYEGLLLLLLSPSRYALPLKNLFVSNSEDASLVLFRREQIFPIIQTTDVPYENDDNAALFHAIELYRNNRASLNDLHLHPLRQDETFLTTFAQFL